MKRISDFLKCTREDKDYLNMGSGTRLHISIFNSIAELPEIEWSKIVPESRALMSRPYLTAIENSSNGNEVSRYALFYKNKTVVAAAIFNIATFTANDYRFCDDEHRNMEKLRNTLKDKARLRVLVCGHTHISGDHGFLYSGAISPDEAYQALVEACCQIKSLEKSNGKIDLYLIKDFYEKESKASSILQTFGYRQFKVDPNMIVKIRPNWITFEDYLNAMTSKYRKKAVSTIKQGAALERRSLTASEIEVNYNKIQQLYFNVANKAKIRINHFDTSYLLQLKLNLKDDFELIGYYVDDKLIGFNTLLFWDDNCEAHAIGIDYNFNSQYALYLNMLYDDVKTSIEKKKSKLILGRTAMEMKSNIGAEPAEMYCYVRHSGPLINKALKPIFSYIKQNEWTQRSPFKEQKELMELQV